MITRVQTDLRDGQDVYLLGGQGSGRAMLLVSRCGDIQEALARAAEAVDLEGDGVPPDRLRDVLGAQHVRLDITLHQAEVPREVASVAVQDDGRCLSYDVSGASDGAEALIVAAAHELAAEMFARSGQGFRVLLQRVVHGETVHDEIVRESVRTHDWRVTSHVLSLRGRTQAGHAVEMQVDLLEVIQALVSRASDDLAFAIADNEVTHTGVAAAHGAG